MSERERNATSSWVVGIIREFLDGPANTLRNEANDRAWGDPLVGFSRGDDPLYESYKDHVGSFHWTPLEAFEQVHGRSSAESSELSVICWILPQMESTKADSRDQTVYPAERWARSRIYGEEVNDGLRKHVAQTLTNAGYQAVAPVLAPTWGSRCSERYGRASTWSERHVAHASGLGTFGLCDGLITPVGKAMRVGSVVARMRIPATPRPYHDHQEYCLFFARGTCGRCIDRCPVGAITRAGHDKERCRAHLNRTHVFVESNYGFDGYGCGLCQTGVPCESGIPTAGD